MDDRKWPLEKPRAARPFALWLLGAVVFLAVAEMALWGWATHALASGYERWRTQMQAQGWVVQADSTGTSGFPFTAALSLSNARIKGGAQAMPGGLAWQASRVVVSVSLFAPLTLSVAPDGEQQLRIANAPRMVFHADRMAARLPVWQARTLSAALEAEALAGGIVGSRHPQDVRVDRISLWLDAAPDASDGVRAQLTLAARQIELPDIGRWPLGAVIAELKGHFLLHSPHLSGHENEPRAAAAAWQKAGGSVALQDALVKWGPMTLSGDAEMSLDTRLQPAGHGTAVLTGAGAALDALVDGGVLQKGVGATAKAVLSAMAQLPGGGGVRLPFTVRDNTLSVGPIPIARLNDVIW